MSGTVVAFDYPAWAAQFPAFDTVPQATVEGYFDMAGLYVANTGWCGSIPVPPRAALMNLVTAHLTQLFSGANGQAPSGLVGAVSSATEGSVSVGVDVGPVTASSAWWKATPYGAAFWQATQRYRTMRYVPAPSNYALTSMPYGFGRYGTVRG